MSKKSLLITGAALTLCLVAIMPVLAQGPPPEHPIFATIEYLEQQLAAVYAYVDEQIAGIGDGGEDFDTASADCYDYVVYDEDVVRQFTIAVPALSCGCQWHGGPISEWVQTRAFVPSVGAGGQEAYGAGSCWEVWFFEFPQLVGGETFDIFVTFFWMGRTKEAHWIAECGQPDPNYEWTRIPCTLQDAP